MCVCLCLCVCVQGRESPQLTSVTQLAMSYFYLSEGYSFTKISQLDSPVKTTLSADFLPPTHTHTHQLDV